MNINSVRVVVVDNDDDGRSYISADGPGASVLKQPNRPTALTDIWQMTAVPTDPRADGRVESERRMTLAPPQNGVVFRIVQFDPMSEEELARVDGAEVFASMNAEIAHQGGEISPVMHRTRSVDFGIVLSGTITMLLDTEAIVVSQGDVVVQKATNHAWENRGDEPAMIAFILVDAQADA